MENILLVDDCPEISNLIKGRLKDYNVHTVANLSQARKFLETEKVELFIIDIELPDGTGFDFCSEISNQPQFENIPKIFLSGQNSTAQKVFGFSCGADDYITKPFSHQELAARVSARLKKIRKRNYESIDNFDFDHNFQSCFIRENGEKHDLDLTPTEFRLFYALVQAINRPLTRHDLVRAVWKANGLNIEKRGIDSHISHLRKKLGVYGVCIASVYGQGYAYRPEMARKS